MSEKHVSRACPRKLGPPISEKDKAELRKIWLKNHAPLRKTNKNDQWNWPETLNSPGRTTESEERKWVRQ